MSCFGTRDCEEHQVMNMDEEIMGRNGNDSVSFNCRDTKLYLGHFSSSVIAAFTSFILSQIVLKYERTLNLGGLAIATQFLNNFLNNFNHVPSKTLLRK